MIVKCLSCGTLFNPETTDNCPECKSINYEKWERLAKDVQNGK